MSDLVYSVDYIFRKPLGYLDIGESMSHYNIPEYQRGYKWSSIEVLKLLTDIKKFEGEGDRFYCLQNITIVPDSKGFYNVVDGQQRLTTLLVLLAFLGESDLVKEKLKYKVRPITAEFITDYVVSQEVEKTLNEENLQKCWEAFIKKIPRYNHQDIYYLFSTAHTIKYWFLKSQTNKDEYRFKLLNKVKLIVNRIASNSEEKIFSNLNSNKVPLDGADLVRAILITRVAKEEGEKAGDIKNIVRVNERRVRIGWEIDEINTWWSQTEVKDYFKYFIRITEKGDVFFNSAKHPINLLLFLHAEAKQQKALTLDFIEEKGNRAIELYNELKNLHQTLQDWYFDHAIYHYLGYIFSLNSAATFIEIWQTWNNSKARHAFLEIIKNKCYKLNFENGSIRSIVTGKDNWYAEKERLIRILILLDIISCIKASHLRLPPKYFKRLGNDIEHIFPQKPEKVLDKKTFIQFLINNGFATDTDNILDNFDSRLYDWTYQQKIDQFINTHINGIAINSIGNLVLLNETLNRSLKNSNYSKKRAAVIKHFQDGNFIQPHTFSLFVRFLVSGNQDESKDLKHWTNDDITNNTENIILKLEDFFTTKTANNG